MRDEDEFDERETQGQVPIKEGALIRKMELRNQESKVVGQRSLYSWSKGPILRGLALQGLLHHPLSVLGAGEP